MIMVRYEELIDEPARVMREVCAAVGLDPDVYPYDQIDELPVLGSSTLTSESGAQVHWAPMERTAAFDPRERWRTWDDHTHRRFDAVAGAQQRALGYTTLDVGGTDSPVERVGDLRDRIWDVWRRQVRVKLGRLRLAARRID
jgi:hypothetical protein